MGWDGMGWDVPCHPQSLLCESVFFPLSVLFEQWRSQLVSCTDKKT